MSSTTTAPAEAGSLSEGVSTFTDEKGRLRLRFDSHPAWCDEFENANGGEHFLADLWHHGAESHRLVLSRHDVELEITDPEAFVPGEGPETINVFLHQQCDQGEPEVHIWTPNANTEIHMTGLEAIAFAHMLHEVLITGGTPPELLPKQ